MDDDKPSQTFSIYRAAPRLRINREYPAGLKEGVVFFISNELYTLWIFQIEFFFASVFMKLYEGRHGEVHSTDPI